MSDDVMFGFGAMRLDLEDENNPSSINYDDVTEMIDYYMDQGFNYFDTSYAYHNGASEAALKIGLVERYPRESFKIADKIPTWALTSEEDNQKFVDEDISLVELPFLLRIRFSTEGTQKELVNLFKVSDGYTAKLLRRFELAGLIKRIEDPSNRRRKLVKLTDKGIKRTDKILKYIDYWEDTVMDGIDEDERKVLKKSLLKLVLNTQKL